MAQPFVRDSVYDEGMELLIGSVIIYIFAELRDMVREGVIRDITLTDLDPPLTANQTLTLIQTHKEALKERALNHEYLESRLQTLQQAYDGAAAQEPDERKKKQQSTKEPLFSAAACLTNFLFCVENPLKEQDQKDTQTTKNFLDPAENDKNATILKRFVDDNSQEELVHGVVVNPFKQRITIIFRGSVTNKDFLQDAKCAQKHLDNPVLAITRNNPTEEEMPARIRIHTGFYEYLFYQRQGSETTRLEEILDDVKMLLRQHPGFSLYMTGHSLGGALSTLCAFYAACDDELISLAANHRVVVYSVASPFCGNWKFRHAFQELERQRRLQHLRIANLEDMVTLLPFAVPKATFLSPALSMIHGGGNLYKHVGIKLQLKRVTSTEGTEVVEHSIQYPKENQKDNDQELAIEVQEAMEAGKSLVRAIYYLCKSDFSTVEKYHSCDEYEQRFETCREGLSQKTLDDLYNDPTIVGKLFADDHRLVPLPKSGFTRALRALSVLSKFNSQHSVSNVSEDVDVDEDEEMTLTQAALANPQ